MTSFFLILFWSWRVQTMKAALKVFLVSQLGDLAFVVGIASAYSALGSACFDAVSAHALGDEHLLAIGSLSVATPTLWCVGFVSAL